jgi:hypothetical protein
LTAPEEPHELRNWMELARAEMEKYADTDPLYAEIMASCLQLGETLLPCHAEDDLHGECKDLERRIFALTDRALAEDAQQWALWQSRQEPSSEAS